jgi:hypothetical protein
VPFKVSHRPGVVGAAEIADACREELERAVKMRAM